MFELAMVNEPSVFELLRFDSMVFVLSLFDLHLSFFWFGRAVLRDCGIAWVYSLLYIIHR